MENLKEQLLPPVEVILGKRNGDLGAAIRELDAVAPTVPGHLGHFLQKRSYEKAWHFLNGTSLEGGHSHHGEA